MQYRDFGRTGFKASVISFGGAAISGEGAGYGFGNISEEEARESVMYAYEKGVNIFDTAPIYGFGESERRLGKFLSRFVKMFLLSLSLELVGMKVSALI
jgi:myo-inositol catabolism protein IolS